jgi:geranylgeranyl diphosphate synthase type I
LAGSRSLLEARIAAYGEAIDVAAATVVNTGTPEHQGLYDMVRYHLGWQDRGGTPSKAPGKKLRPTLCFLVAEALGADWKIALPAATAVELVHNFSLIHDDIQDQSRLRRHQEAVWAVWGIAQGINAGDALLIIAEQAIADVEPHLPPERALGAYRLLLDACRALCEGQYLDLLWENAPAITVDQYLGMIERKTASLFACTAELGAYCAGADAPTRSAFHDFGQALGLAFQVADDVLGIWGPEQETGKSAALDLISRKKTLPVLLGLDSRFGPIADRLRELFAKDSPLTIEEAQQTAHWLEELGTREQTLAYLNRYTGEAMQMLQRAAPGENAQLLKDFLASMLPIM